MFYILKNPKISKLKLQDYYMAGVFRVKTLIFTGSL